MWEELNKVNNWFAMVKYITQQEQTVGGLE